MPKKSTAVVDRSNPGLHTLDMATRETLIAEHPYLSGLEGPRLTAEAEAWLSEVAS